MPVYRIPKEHLFPPPDEAEPGGLLGVGGDLDPHRLVLAYTMGIFPWYSEGQPILWFSPDPRFVLFPGELVVQRSLQKRLRQQPYRITLDTAFPEVIASCRQAPRPGQSGTWITGEMQRAYTRLFELGVAHSVEAWEGDTLVGGLYGVAFGTLFCGESMFARAPDASKIAFVHLVRQLERWGFELIDSQVYTNHLERFGAREIPRQEYLDLVHRLVKGQHRPGPWAFDAAFALGEISS